MSVFFRYLLNAMLILVFVCIGVSQASAQSLQGGTPEAAPAPKFFIAALGDYPEGYFKDVTIEPGSSVELAVVIKNSGQIPVALHSYKVNALSIANGGFAAGQEGDSPIGSTAWIEFPALDLELEPGESHEQQFTVTVPEGTPPGQYMSGLMVQTADAVEIPGTDLVDQIIGYSISVSIIVPGDFTSSFAIGEPEIVSSVNSRVISVPLMNTGNYLVRPEGELVLTDGYGKEIHSKHIAMGSVYMGLDTVLWMPLSSQMPAGDYELQLNLIDPDSGATASVDGVAITVPEPVDPTGVSVLNASIEPNAEEIVFANVDVTFNNGGSQIPASDVTLEVLHDGEQVDEFPLATNQVLLNGENTYTTRYIPADMWEPGTYTFRIVVSAVDPNGGQETILLTEDLDAEIVVP